MRALLVVCVALGACGDDGGDGPGDDSGDAGPRADAAPTDAAMRVDGGPPAGSDGCGVAAELATGEFVAQTIDVDGTTRDWSVWLPAGYDPDRRYPVDYQFHGCSDNPMRENNNVPVQRESGGDAIHVRGRAVERCWDTSADGPDVAFFDALIEEVESRWCTDPDRRFATGYSGGAFMIHRLACVRGDVLRGVASIAGGQGGRDCSGEVAALLIHDRDDPTVGIDRSEAARDSHVERNGCETTRSSAEAPCEAHDGCDEGLPVVWCETSGMNHSRQDDLAAPAFWGFLSTL